MDLKEFFKLTIWKTIIILFLIIINFPHRCIGGLCKHGFPLEFLYGYQIFSWTALLINIIIYYIMSCIILYLVNKYGKERKLLRYILIIIFFWLILFLAYLIFHLGRSRHFLDSDVYIYSLGFSIIYTIFFILLVLFVALIIWIVSKFKK